MKETFWVDSSRFTADGGFDHGLLAEHEYVSVEIGERAAWHITWWQGWDDERS